MADILSDFEDWVQREQQRRAEKAGRAMVSVVDRTGCRSCVHRIKKPRPVLAWRRRAMANRMRAVWMRAADAAAASVIAEFSGLQAADREQGAATLVEAACRPL